MKYINENTPGIYGDTPWCGCKTCNKLREIKQLVGGGWVDPRRGYYENEKDFLERVPDGLTKWEDDHESLGLDWMMKPWMREQILFDKMGKVGEK